MAPRRDFRLHSGDDRRLIAEPRQPGQRALTERAPIPLWGSPHSEAYEAPGRRPPRLDTEAEGPVEIRAKEGAEVADMSAWVGPHTAKGTPQPTFERAKAFPAIDFAGGPRLSVGRTKTIP